MLVVHDQQPVETLRANGAHEAIRQSVRLRRANRRTNHAHPLGAEHFVKPVGEFLVPVANQEAEGRRAVLTRPREVPGLRRDPRRARIRRAAREMDTATAQFDEEEDIQPLQPNRLDGEEVDRQQVRRCARRNSRQVIPPREPAGPRPPSRSPRPHRRGGDRQAQALQFAHNPLISPPRVLARETEDQRSDLTSKRRATDSMRVGPPLRHQATMPPPQRGGCDEEGLPGGARQELTRRRQKQAVGPRHRWTARVSSEDSQFVPQHDNPPAP